MGKNIEWLFASLKNLSFISMSLRLVIAMAFGGVIGLEPTKKRRAAGFRTYMLVCIGAALAMLLGQYEEIMSNTIWADALQNSYTRVDVSRFAAQVVNGIGFLGAGTIIVTAKQEVKGLTTAAALWASACTGLAIGAGFYEVVCMSFIVIVICFMVLPIFEEKTVANGRNLNVYVEFDRLDDIANIIQYIKGKSIQVTEVDVNREIVSGVRLRPNAVLTLQLPKRQPHANILAELAELGYVCVVEEI